MNLYTAYLENGSSDRSIQIVTDTFQNACGIARSQCRSGEQVTSVIQGQTDVIIDFAACKDAHEYDY